MTPEATSLDHYCPDHYGHILTRSGYCIYGQHRPEMAGESAVTRAPMKAEAIKEPDMRLVHNEVEVEKVTTTIEADRLAANTETMLDDGELQEPGKYEQLPLDPDLFARAKREKVKMVKVAFSGSVDMTRRDFESMCSAQLEPGREVALAVSGFVPAPHAKWVKRSEGTGEDKMTWWEQEGQVAIKVTDIPGEEGIKVGGFYRDYD